MLIIDLTPDQREKLGRPANAAGPATNLGGFQRLLRRLQAGIKLREGGWKLELSREDAQRVLRYTDPAYGPGSYQTRLGTIRLQIKAALSSEPQAVTASLFAEDTNE